MCPHTLQPSGIHPNAAELNAPESRILLTLHLYGVPCQWWSMDAGQMVDTRAAAF